MYMLQLKRVLDNIEIGGVLCKIGYTIIYKDGIHLGF